MRSNALDGRFDVRGENRLQVHLAVTEKAISGQRAGARSAGFGYIRLRAMEEVEPKGNQPSFEAFIVPANGGKLCFRPVACRRTGRGVQAIAGSGGQ